MIVDPFAGPGGWSTGLAALGHADIGVEHDRAACETRAAAGHLTIRADVARFPIDRLIGRTTGVIASSPCQAFSLAGKGEGSAQVDALLAAARARDWLALRDDHAPEVWLPLEVGRWLDEIRPEWVALEQVPPALVLLAEVGRWLDRWGYSVWVGVLNAADFGVPQTRRRAILIASRTRTVVPPEPTHAERGAATLFGSLPRWVSMADALGFDGAVGFPRVDDRGDSADGYRARDWRATNDPAFAVTEKARSWIVRTGANSMKHSRDPDDVVLYERPIDLPAPTLDRKAGGAWRFVDTARPNGIDRTVDHSAPTILASDDNGNRRFVFDRRTMYRDGSPTAPLIPGTEPAPTLTGTGLGKGVMEIREEGSDDGAFRLTLDQAARLQSFPDGYPWRGTRTAKFRQIGDAVPPLLAFHVLKQVIDPTEEVAP